MTNTLSVERRAALKRQAQAIGYDLDYHGEKIEITEIVKKCKHRSFLLMI